MKKAFILLTIALLSTSIKGQSFKAIVDQGPCLGYDVVVNDITLNSIDSCEFEIDQELASLGTEVTMSCSNNTEFPSIFGVTTLDLVLLFRVMSGNGLEGFDLNKVIYSADWDQDGVVSTYDFVAVSAQIRGAEFEYDLPQYHLIPADAQIPDLDPFDIAVDYSELNFIYDNAIDSLNIEVLRIGDLSIHSN